MRKVNKRVLLAGGVKGSLLFFTPLISFAQQLVNPPANANELLNRIGTYIVNPIIYLMFTVAFVVFIWGLVEFVAHLDNEEARATGGKHMLWGIIGMAIMSGVVGIVAIIQNTIAGIGG